MYSSHHRVKVGVETSGSQGKSKIVPVERVEGSRTLFSSSFVSDALEQVF